MVGLRLEGNRVVSVLETHTLYCYCGRSILSSYCFGSLYSPEMFNHLFVYLFSYLFMVVHRGTKNECPFNSERSDSEQLLSERISTLSAKH